MYPLDKCPLAPSEGRVKSMSDKLCHCARPVKVVVGDGSAEAPFELEYADEEGSGSSDGLNHSEQGSSEYFEPRQVSVEDTLGAR